MKRLISTIILFMLPVLFVTAQPAYYRFLNDPSSDDLPFACAETGSGGLVMISGNRPLATGIQHITLSRFSEAGVLCDTVMIQAPEPATIRRIMPLGGENFLAVGAKGDGSGLMNLWMFRFDTLLNIYCEKEYRTGHQEVWPFSVKSDSRGNIVVCGFLLDNPDPFHGFMYVVRPEGDVPDSLIFPLFGSCVSEVLEKKDSSGYLIFTHGFSQITGSFAQVLALDTGLNVLTCDSLPGRLDGYYCNSAWVSDTSYFLTGRRNNSPSGDPAGNQLEIFEIDRDRHLLREKELGKKDTLDYPGLQGNMDFDGQGSVYFGGSSNLANSVNPFIDGNSWVVLNKLDAGLALQWQKYYGGDAYYTLWTVNAMRDGGCMLLGTRYDGQSQAQQRDIVMIRVDREGQMTSEEEYSLAGREDVRLSPNPGSGEIRVRTGFAGPCSLELYDLTGRLACRLKLGPHQMSFSASDLNSGMYTYVVYNGNVPSGRGKFIKY